jgi:hypothetical protein
MDFYTSIAAVLASSTLYAYMSDAAAATALNEQTVTTTLTQVSTGYVKGLLMATGEWAVIKANTWYPGVSLTPVVAACTNLIDACLNLENIVINDPANMTQANALLTALQGAGLVSSLTVSALMALQYQVSPAFDRVITDQDIAHVKGS